MKRKNLNAIPNSITQQYFSTLFYYKKGYMADWLFNAATEKGITELKIDILNYKIYPQEIQIKPLVTFLPNLKQTIKKTLAVEGFPADFIKEAILHIKIFEKENRLRCIAILTDVEDKNYMGQEYTEYPYDNSFKVFKARSANDMDWANEEDNALNTSEWFGAILRYFFHLGRRPFNTYYNQKQLKKNAIIGNIFQILLLITVFYFLYQYS